jgi:hypothetical protein
MRQDRDHFNPKPRPRGYTGNVGNIGNVGNTRPFSSRPSRPAPPPRAARAPRPAGAPVIEPKRPKVGKERRRMLKAAAWRLARLVHSAPASLLKMDHAAIEDLIELKCPPSKVRPGSPRGDAMRLAAKLERLRH